MQSCFRSEIRAGAGTALLGLAVFLGAGWTQLATASEVSGEVLRADPENPVQVTQGKTLYEQHCAGCHGADLKGQPDWRRWLPDGKLPAPPHDESGHTWHHSDATLFGITKHGMVPPYAPEGLASDMPAYENVLSDADIWAVLAYIKSTWPEEAREYQEEVNQQSPD